jgi:hypothetical protein
MIDSFMNAALIQFTARAHPGPSSAGRPSFTPPTGPVRQVSRFLEAKCSQKCLLVINRY